MSGDEQRLVLTKEDIKRGLRELGLKQGDILGVHSSLSSFGYVEGRADAVINALLEVVGEEGAVVMPTYSTNRIELDHILILPRWRRYAKTMVYQFDLYDIPRDQFLVGGKAWQMCRAGEADPNKFGIGDLKGLWFIRGNLILDLAAQNKMGA